MSKQHTLFTLSAVATGIIFAGQASAIEPQPIDLGGVGLVPTLKISETYDDNVKEASGIPGDEERSSWVTTIEPSLTLAARERLNTYQLSYSLSNSIYHSSHEDDHTDHFLRADSHMEFSARSRLDLNAGYSKQQDTVDSTNREFDEIGNKYHSTNVGGLYGFGAQAAKMQLELGANHEWRKYDNNRDSGSLTREKDRDTLSLVTTGYYRVAPKTRLLAEVQYSDYDYTTSNLDSEDYRYLVGVTWDATAKTTGTAKFGYQEKEFDDPSKGSTNGGAWDVGVSWSPVTYSTFSLNTGSNIGEGSSTEDFIDTDTYSLTWSHTWAPRFSSDVGYSLTKKDYEGGSGSSNAGRKDELDSYNLSLNYNMRRWLDLGLGYSYKDNSSNFDDSRFDRNQVFFNVNMSL
ncbi:outer membrane beta-barrel protein [Zobellella maritima]|uniref:outer membrane beta-barrel protein n=1 Tax=Zobellella maritima TaxID=2059725 RepID=UPI000E30B0CE|nr:outer membrane beta-barrel protein [Zobellella maritima]